MKTFRTKPKVSERLHTDVEQVPVKDKRRGLKPLLFVGISLFLLMAALKFKDVAEFRDGEWRLKEKRREEINRKTREVDEAEMYHLLARSSHYYPCYLCQSKKIWLNAGEIAKIGSTTTPNKRYSDEWLNRNDVNYVTQVKGNLAAVRKAEISDIGAYPLRPENLNRLPKYRLVVPPFHKTTTLE